MILIVEKGGAASVAIKFLNHLPGAFL